MKFRQIFKHIAIIFFIVLSIFKSSFLYASSEKEYKVKAAFIYNFIKFIQWSEESQLDSLKICILGENKFGKLLDALAKKKVRKLPLKVIYSKNIEDISKCNLAYLQLSEDKITNYLTEDSNILTISDVKGFAKKYGIIEIKQSGTKLKFEINVTMAKKHQLKISSKLLQLADEVH